MTTDYERSRVGSPFAVINRRFQQLPGFQGLNNIGQTGDAESARLEGNTTQLERVCRDAENIADDVIQFFINPGKKPLNRHCKTMRRTVQELSKRHDILFKTMINRLQVDDMNLFISFTYVTDEIFEDGQINWGRVVAVYAFAARLALHFHDIQKPEKCNQIALYTGRYVGKKLGKWIIESGGWDNFSDFFPEQVQEDRLWRGFVFAAFGLGALVIATQ
ncbi:anti-apoptotic protein NR13 [Octopus bimaculoides]|uniref:Bcl-2 Bcl-2 homology region 1-3 domain-containing protein n=1 Tax=Octopus bimaculoides TaxID=37653 RepID=A0A0L8HQA5_OCTBM|nr:anti-apoptotic protein NR13 [Octopus bimaculoides]|eukprot:XP_014770366.1 PREDICTED: anti-apoptotic protein NR13-like [Octopus bimaculoides]